MPIPGMGPKLVQKTGYVSEYTLKEDKSDPFENWFFFEVTITDGQSPQSGTAPVTFKLIKRDKGGASIVEFSEKRMIEMAMISTIKDALINSKRVFAEGKEFDVGGGRKYALLTSITLKVS